MAASMIYYTYLETIFNLYLFFYVCGYTCVQECMHESMEVRSQALSSHLSLGLGSLYEPGTY